MVAFYNAGDQELYKQYQYLPQEQYRLSLNLPKAEQDASSINTSFGIPATNAFTNMNAGGDGGAEIQTLDPYSRPKGTPLDPNSFLGKTFQGVKDFGSSVVDKFSGLPGVEQGKGLIQNILDNTLIGRMVAMRNPLNPNAGNYNPDLQGQIDFLSGLSSDGHVMIGRDPNTGLAKYGPDSILSGLNVVSGFGTNDYGQQLQNYYDKYADTMSPERLAKLEAEMAALEEKEEEDYQTRIKDFVTNYNRPGVKQMFDEVYDGTNIHGGDNTTGGTTTGGGEGDGTYGVGSDGQKSYDSGQGFGVNATTGGPVSNKTGRGRTDYMNGGLASIL